MAQCEHHYKLDDIENTGKNVRTAHVTCTKCGYKRAIVTARKDEDIIAEIENQ